VGREVEVGAEVLNQEAVSRRSTTDLNRGYLVLDLGISPRRKP
jgi:hypothetical protein